MSVNSRPKPLSMSEFLGGGVALASVALIALGGARMIQPRDSLPAYKRYASVSIKPSAALVKLSIEQLTDVGGVAHDVQSSDADSETAKSVPIERNGAEGSRPLSADRPPPPIEERPVVQRRQVHVIEAGVPRAFADVMSGLPLSGELRGFQPTENQRSTMPAPPIVRAEPTFVGGWTVERGRCRASGKAPLVISTHAAKTANGECDFGFVVRETANRWRVTAICAAEGNFWRANIALKLMEPNLTWSSERGTETYVRCRR